MTEQLVSENESPKKLCIYCSKELAPHNRSGVCKECAHTSFERICSKCGKLYHKWGRILTTECTVCQRKATNLKKYGCEHSTQNKEIKKKKEQTTLERYGVTSAAKLPEFEQKKRATVRERYGVDCVTQCKDFKEKRKATLIEHFGTDNYSTTEEYREKRRATSLQNWGTEFPSQSPLIRKRVQATCLEKYGVEDYMSTQEFQKASTAYKTSPEGLKKQQEVAKQTILQPPHKKGFVIDDTRLDSTWEVAFYLFCRDKGCNIQRNIKGFEYSVKDHSYLFYPDFLVDGVLYEIKGEHLLTDLHGKLVKEKTEAKLKLCEEKHINIILGQKAIYPYLRYVRKVYGKDFALPYKCN